ncbi:MAG: hypothetical protein PVF83_12575, partial [Anaerolineales bacterium]
GSSSGGGVRGMAPSPADKIFITKHTSLSPHQTPTTNNLESNLWTTPLSTNIEPNSKSYPF